MFDTLCDLVPRDNAYPERVRKLTMLNRVLDGTLYDILPYHFHEERSEAGEYIPLRQRRPSVRYPLCRIVVEDSVSLLFSEGHFPTIDSPDPAVRSTFASIIKSIHGNRASPDKVAAAQSGRALELLNQGLMWLADNLRTTYGEVGLLQIARLIVRASRMYTLVVFGEEIGPLASDTLLSLKWPRWYPTTADDRQKDVQSLTSLVTAGCISRATALKAIAACYDIEYVEDQPISATPDDIQ